MEELLIFYNRWILLVEEIRVGAGAPANRLSINGTRASDGVYNNPQPGLTIDADGAEWTLRLDVSFDLQPFQWRRLDREFFFDPSGGMIALAQTEKNQPPAFRSYIRIRCLSKNPEIQTVPNPLPYDFTIPEGPRGHRPHR